MALGFSERERLKDRIAGCLLGVAIGDALGAPFEHLKPGETCRQLEETGGRVVDFHGNWNGPKGGWTDDTSLTLAACRGFLEAAQTRCPIPSALHGALRSAGGSPGFRKPGKTILNAVLTGFSDVDAWSNGALMRIAPAAIYAVLANASRVEAAHLALFLARLTHGHPLAVFPAAECALAILSILRGDKEVPNDLGDFSALEGFVQEHLRYEEYLQARHEPMKTLSASTGLWMWRFVFEHLLEMGPGRPWSCLPPFEDGLIHAVSDSYDRDTAGAIAGAILGGYWGASAIPPRWLSGVEMGSEIRQMAEEMLETIKPREGNLTAVMAANSLKTEVFWVRVDPDRAWESLTAHVACLQAKLEFEVASGRLGFALLILPQPSGSSGRVLLLSSPEPVSSFDWKVMNPHLPWETWKKTARVLEEWKEFDALRPPIMDPFSSTKSRFRFVGSFSSGWENVIWEAVETGLLPMVLLDGRWAEPVCNVLSHLEGGSTREELPGNRVFRLEERCVQIMEKILDAPNLPLNPHEASFLLDAFARATERKSFCLDELQVVSRFWWTVLEHLHEDLYGKLANVLKRRWLWEETARYLAEIPKERLLHVFRVLRASTQADGRRLAVRVGMVLGCDAPWTEMIPLLDDSDSEVRAEMLQALDSLGASDVASFLQAYAEMEPSGAFSAATVGNERALKEHALKKLLLGLSPSAAQSRDRSWEQKPYLRASLCRLLLQDTDDPVQSSIVEMLQQEGVWRVMAREHFQRRETNFERILPVVLSRNTESARRLAARLLALVGCRAPEDTVSGILGDPDPSVVGEFVRAVGALKEDRTVWNETVSRPYPVDWFEMLLKSKDESLLIAALDVVEAFSVDENLAEKIEALAVPYRPDLALAAAGALTCFPGGIPRALQVVQRLLRDASKDVGEKVGEFLIQRLAVEESRVVVEDLLAFLKSNNVSVAEAAAYVLAWAGDESTIPHLKKAHKHYGKRLFREAWLALQGDYKQLSSSMGYFRALHPRTRRLVDRAREIAERRPVQS